MVPCGTGVDGAAVGCTAVAVGVGVAAAGCTAVGETLAGGSVGGTGLESSTVGVTRTMPGVRVGVGAGALDLHPLSRSDPSSPARHRLASTPLTVPVLSA